MTINKKDTIFVGEQISDKKFIAIKKSQGQIQAGTISILEDGKPLYGNEELVQLSPRDDNWYDVEYFDSKETGSGPPQVATKVYRQNYDRIFSKNLLN